MFEKILEDGCSCVDSFFFFNRELRDYQYIGAHDYSFLTIFSIKRVL